SSIQNEVTLPDDPISQKPALSDWPFASDPCFFLNYLHNSANKIVEKPAPHIGGVLFFASTHEEFLWPPRDNGFSGVSFDRHTCCTGPLFTHGI
ncbi:MAG TPA: hypothetical protein VMB19_07035, partial [Silvibacterium sp.]|nr:hypothetical protein [Silvibacterium sp.]